MCSAKCDKQVAARRRLLAEIVEDEQQELPLDG